MLTPEEIQSREFLVSLRGYDRDEVHAFLDEVAEAFAQLLAEDGAAATPAPTRAAEPAAEPPTTPAVSDQSPFAAIGAETQRILEAAQSAGDAIRQRAQSEAEQARDAALAEAKQEVELLREQAVATQQQIDQLEQRRGELADRLRQARETVDLALVEVDDTPEPEPADVTNSVLAAEAVATEVEVVDDDDAADATGPADDELPLAEDEEA